MNKIFALIAALLTVTAMTASDHTVARKSPTGEVSTLRIDTEMPFSDRAAKKSPIAKEGEEYLTIHVKFVYPDNLVPELAAYNENGLGWSVWWEGEDEMELKIPVAGIYKGDNIFVGSFTPIDKTAETNPYNWYFVFVELPELTDGAEVVFDANTIDRTYKVEFLNKEGKPFTLKHSIYDTETKEEVYDGEGDLEYGFGGIWIGGASVVEKAGMVFFLLDRSYSDGRPDLKLPSPPAISTNALPEGIEVNAVMLGRNMGAAELFMISTPSTNVPGAIRNNVADYMDGSFRMSGTPVGAKEEVFGMKMNLRCNGWRSNGWGLHFENFLANEGAVADVKLTTCIAVSENPGIGMQYEAAVELEDRANGGLISSQPILPDHSNGVLNYIQFNNTFGDTNDLYSRSFNNWDHPSIFANSNPYMPPKVSDYAGILGNCCPAFVSLGMWPETYGQFPVDLKDYIFDYGYLGASYVGRNGESMTVDAWQAVITPEVQGDFQLYNFRMDNVLVDGKVPGCNSAVLGCDFNLADWVPPTLQTVFFTNTAGVVTDRFGSAGEATMTLYAGDFEYVYNESFTEDMMAVKPLADMKVEYSPYGTEDYAELAVAENAGKFWMPGYGYCYEGSLASVTRTSPNGWFDLRVTLKDANGNWQEQTISPAFYVAELSGVKSVEVPQGDFRVSDGRIVCETNCDIAVYTIDGRCVPNANLAPGVYVARANGAARKVHVR